MAEEVACLWLYNHPWRNVIHDRVGGLSEPTLADGTSDLIVMLRPEPGCSRSVPLLNLAAGEQDMTGSDGTATSRGVDAHLLMEAIGCD